MSTGVQFKKSGITASAIYSGFGERLNYLINLTNLKPPEASERRNTWLADHLNCNKTTVWHWFRDQPPKDGVKTSDAMTVSLHDVIIFLLSNTNDYSGLNVIKVIGWMRYGDAVGYNPFLEKDLEDMGVNFSRMLLSTRVLIDEAKKLQDSPFISEPLVQHTSEYFVLSGISDYNFVMDCHREVIASFIKIGLSEQEYVKESDVNTVDVLRALKLLDIEIQEITDVDWPSQQLVEQTAKYMLDNEIDSHESFDSVHKQTIGIFIKIATERYHV